MQRIAVNSSQIASVGYDIGTGTLEIEFKPFARKGEAPKPTTLYRYKNVPQSLHEALIGAESVGSYFRRNIKPFPEKYPFEKIG